MNILISIPAKGKRCGECKKMRASMVGPPGVNLSYFVACIVFDDARLISREDAYFRCPACLAAEKKAKEMKK
jgi:hypothetical protein